MVQISLARMITFYNILALKWSTCDPRGNKAPWLPEVSFRSRSCNYLTAMSQGMFPMGIENTALLSLGMWVQERKGWGGGIKICMMQRKMRGGSLQIGSSKLMERIDSSVRELIVGAKIKEVVGGGLLHYYSEKVWLRNQQEVCWTGQ